MACPGLYWNCFTFTLRAEKEVERKSLKNVSLDKDILCYFEPYNNIDSGINISIIYYFLWLCSQARAIGLLVHEVS
jgi:hypothetical protein